MRLTPLPFLVVAVTACATLRGQSDAERRYREGLDALARSDFAAAAAALEFASRSDDANLSRRALTLLVTVELDPANPARRLDAAIQLADRLRESSVPATPEYLTAESLARAARETRDLQRGLADAEAGRDGALARADSLRTRIDAVTAERDSARRRAVQLEQLGDSLKQELKLKTQELERIRRAIRG